MDKRNWLFHLWGRGRILMSFFCLNLIAMIGVSHAQVVDEEVPPDPEVFTITDNGLDGSRIITQEGGGDTTLRDSNRTAETSLPLTDLHLKFKILYKPSDITDLASSGGAPASTNPSCTVIVDGETGDFTGTSNGGRPTFRFDNQGGTYCGGGVCEVSANCGGTITTYEILDPTVRDTQGGFLWKPVSYKDTKLVVFLPPSLAWEGDGTEDGGDSREGIIEQEFRILADQDKTLVEIDFKGDSDLDISFDYTDFEIVANDGTIIDLLNVGPSVPVVPIVTNIVKGQSKLTFDIFGPDESEIDITIKNLRVYITNGQGKDSEQLRIKFNEIEYFTDNFFLDTLSEYCDGIGKFVGATGLNGIFKAGDKMRYIPLTPNRGQEYFLNLGSIDLGTLVPVGTEITIPIGTTDNVDMSFPLVEENRATGEYVYTCTTSPISIDNEFSVFADNGSYTGETGPNTTFRIGDQLIYHHPFPVDEDTFTVDMRVLDHSATTPSETQNEILESSQLDDAALVMTVTATDNAGNVVTFDSPPFSIDTIRPIFEEEFWEDEFFIKLFIPQVKLDDPRYKGFLSKFSEEKPIWGNGDHLEIQMPEDDTTDDGDPLVSVDFTDISSTGNIEYSNDPAELEIVLDRYFETLYTNISEIATYIDLAVYQKIIRYTDNAGNDPIQALDANKVPNKILTNAVAIDLIAPQVPLAPPSYTILEILSGKLIAIIGDLIGIKAPLQDVRSEDLWYSTFLQQLGGASAEFLFVRGYQTFPITAGELQAGNDYNRVIYYFDKAFNLIERDFDKIFVDNRVPTFDLVCGATFTVVDKTAIWGDVNQIADITFYEPDEVIFKAPDNSIDGCDLETWSLDFTPITGRAELIDSYSKIPADGRELRFTVGPGTLDDLRKQFVMQTYDEYNNVKEYLTGVLAIDNEIAIRTQILDHAEFASFQTTETTLYLGVFDKVDISLITGQDDIQSVKVWIDGAIDVKDMVQDPLTAAQVAAGEKNTNPWRVIGEVNVGDFSVEPKFLKFLITDDARNIVELEGNQKIFISNKVDHRGADGGTTNLHREGFSGGIPVYGRGDYLREKGILSRAKIDAYLSAEEKYEARIKFLVEHGFELGPDEKGFLKARSLGRRLSYIKPNQGRILNPDKKPSYWELLKYKFKISRDKTLGRVKEPQKFEQIYRRRIDPNNTLKDWDEKADKEGGIHIQNTLDILKRSSAPKFKKPGSLRKTELSQRGKKGVIRWDD